MANTVATIRTSQTKSTVLTTSTPVATKIIRGQADISELGGVTVDYNTVQNDYILVYNSSSNSFVVAPQASASGVDGGLFNNGTF